MTLKLTLGNFVQYSSIHVFRTTKFYADIFEDGKEFFLTMIDVPSNSNSFPLREPEYSKVIEHLLNSNSFT